MMGTTDAKQPIRVYSSTGESDDEVTRVGLLLAEIDRTKALKRQVLRVLLADRVRLRQLHRRGDPRVPFRW